jgi:hypothetical protein
MNEIKQRLEAILEWSDRLGSDEIAEIEEIIELCKDEINGYK